MLVTTDEADAPSLAQHPWRYPGSSQPTAVLLGVSGPTDPAAAPLVPRRHRRLGQALVGTSGGEVPLNFTLLRANTAPIDHRYPVAAFGSNADPEVLRRKFTDGRVSAVVPLVPAVVRGLAIAASAHVSTPGFIPAAAEVRADQNLDTVIAWLDEEQLACLNDTEPNYTPLVITSAAHPIELAHGELLAAVTLYNTRHGTLALDPAEARVQEQVWRRLLASVPDLRSVVGLPVRPSDEDLRAVMLQLSKDEVLRTEASAVLKQHGSASRLADERERRPPTYGLIRSEWLETLAGDPTKPAYTVGPGPDAVNRRGEALAYLPAGAMARLNVRGHATMRRAGAPPSGPDVLVAVRAHEPPPDQYDACADQVARNAVGVEVMEPVTFSPATVRSMWISNLVLDRPIYVTCRAQPADLATVERDVCLLDSLTLSLIGIRSGDEVTVEGLPGSGGDRVPSIRLHAHEASGDVLNRRVELSGGRSGSRFPSSRDALGVYPDLPWVFIDSTSRDRLNVPGKLGTVRIRASRRFQLVRELRELVLVMMLALVGLSSVIDSVQVILGCLLALIVLAFAVVILRLRTRLANPRRPSG